MRPNSIAILILLVTVSVAVGQQPQGPRDFTWMELKRSSWWCGGEIGLCGLFAQHEPRKMPEMPHCPNTGWWGDRTAGLVGGTAGSIFGFLGGLIGTLASFGKARRFVLALTAGLAGLGVVSFIIGMVALALGQPYSVYYPLLLIGIIMTAVCGGNLPGLRRRYEQLELRKMAAMDGP
jgi:hypothetical protein